MLYLVDNSTTQFYLECKHYLFVLILIILLPTYKLNLNNIYDYKQLIILANKYKFTKIDCDLSTLFAQF